ncbi:MAG: HAD hydrolase-like protein, partial [Pseudomonadota bacterium]
EQVLTELDLISKFSAILGGDLTVSKKPNGAHILETVALAHGEISRAIMIGDSQTDERVACFAELPFIMVSFGYGSLSDAPLSHLEEVDHWKDVEPAINRIVN